MATSTSTATTSSPGSARSAAKTPALLGADGSNNRLVDDADLPVWSANFGVQPVVAAASTLARSALPSGSLTAVAADDAAADLIHLAGWALKDAPRRAHLDVRTSAGAPLVELHGQFNESKFAAAADAALNDMHDRRSATHRRAPRPKADAAPTSKDALFEEFAASADTFFAGDVC